MSQKLTSKQIIALAQLAKLKLTDEEIVRYQQELSAILQYVELLSQVDTKNIEPTSQVTGLTNVMRPDTVAEQGATPEQLLAVVPRVKDGYIQVGRMI